MDWSEIKTGDSDPMNFYSDKSSMAIDFYHSLACYLALGGGNAKLCQTSDCNWIMPDLARNAESAASLVTKYVREAVVGPAIPGLRAVPDLVPIHPILPHTVHIHL